MTALPDRRDLRPLAASIVRAHLLQNPVAAAELPMLIESVHAALDRLGRATSEPESPVPAVPVKRSIRPDHLVCLEDGIKLKTLKRHLAVHHGMTPAEYRAKWGLPADYPMTAVDYSKARSGLARAAGLGRKRSDAAAPVPVEAAPIEAAPPVSVEPAPVEAEPPAPKPARRTLRLVLPKD